MDKLCEQVLLDRCFRKARPCMVPAWHSKCHSARLRSAGLNTRDVLAGTQSRECCSVCAVVWSLSRVRFLVQSNWDDRLVTLAFMQGWKTRLPLRLSPAPASEVDNQSSPASCRNAVDLRLTCARLEEGLGLGHPFSIVSCSNLNSSCEGSHR